MKDRVAVVIPYFQRESGILAGALQSVSAQEVDADLSVIIVDDGSPVRAHDELGRLVEFQWPK